VKIRLLAFATAADAVGTHELDFELPDGSDVESLIYALEASYPRLGLMWSRLAIAVNGEIVSRREPLHEGAEVALLPPVSGGVPEPAEGPSATALVDGPLTVETAIEQVMAPSRGAVVLFVGTVRGDHDGEPVRHLTYSAYRPMADEVLGRIVADLEREEEDLRLVIHHRLGEVPVGAASVVIAVASPHRAAAYAVSRRALERLKAEAPIWKREQFASGSSVWREHEPLVRV
jgi:molybdopterin synthase catalytic subunit/molybdopterin converting factor small subunit